MNDLRYAIRQLAKRPGFTAAVVVTLALGIGANVAIFTVYDALFLRPLPYPAPERLVQLDRTHPSARFHDFSYPDLQDLRAQSRTLSAVGGWSVSTIPMMRAAGIEPVAGAFVTGGFFQTLGARPYLGRLLGDEDFPPADDHRVVLSYSAWRRDFGGDSALVGRTVRLSLEGGPEAVVVVGVLAPNPLQYPDPAIALWIPVSVRGNASRGSRFLTAIGRLASGVSSGEAIAETRVIAGRLEAADPEANSGRGIAVRSLQEAVVGNSRLLLNVLLAAVAAVLVIACANVANLLLARALGREQDLAVQLALGAGASRVTRQLLVESVVLAGAAGLAGVLSATWLVDAFVALVPGGLPRGGEVSIDGRVLGFALGLALLSGLATGVVPALQFLRRHPAATLRGSRAVGANRVRGRMRRALAGAQVALSVVLLVGAGLLLKSFWLLQHVNKGFDPDQAAVVAFSLPEDHYPTAAAARDFYDRFERAVGATPGVADVGLVNIAPLSGGGSCNEVEVQGRTAPAGECPQNRRVDPGYFRLMQIPVVAGRGFTVTDAPGGHVAVVSATMAEQFWPAQSALGKSITLFGQQWQVVGVVGDVRQMTLASEPGPAVYVPLAQQPSRYLNAIVRPAPSGGNLVRTIRESMRGLDPDIPVWWVRPYTEMIMGTVATPRFASVLIAALAGLALLVSAVGAYAVIAHDVANRTREFGVRMAFGARGTDVVRQVVRQVATVAVAAIAVGLLGAAAATRVLRTLLFHVDSLDPWVMGAVALLLCGVMLIAALLPARRATRVDPMEALRYE